MVVFDHIIDNIYLGDLESVTKCFTMKKIDVIIDVSNQQYYEYPSKKYYHFDLTPHTMNDVIRRFDQVVEQTSNKMNILIHCVVGISRSTTLMLYYLMKYKGYYLREAYNLLSLKREQDVSPHFGLFKRLLLIEKQIYGVNTLTCEDYIRFT